MSYILEALKKADAERERGAVPGLHTQAEPLPDDIRPRASAPTWVWVLAGLSAGAALVMGYALWHSANPATQAAVPAAASGAVVTAMPGTPGAPALPAPLTTGVAPVPLALPGPPRPPGSTRSPVKNTVTAPPHTTARTPVVGIAELPEEVRRELPTLSIGGAMHSDHAASRMLILNNGVFHEGDEPYPGLVLEEIKLKAAVFRFKGWRYSVNY